MRRRKALIFSRCLFLIILFCILFLNGDGYPADKKTAFDGWERPILPPDTSPAEESENVIIEVKTEQITSITPFETEKEPPEMESGPKLTVGSPMTVFGEEGILYPIYLSWHPDQALCGLLFQISGGDIYALTPGDIPQELSFSYIIYNGCASVLLDGHINEKNGFLGVICYVATNQEEQVPRIRMIEYMKK